MANSLREQLDTAAQAAQAPVKIELVSLSGQEAYIKRLSPRNIREWYIWLFPPEKVERTFEQQELELFVRTCCDAEGNLLYTNTDTATLREQAGFGAVMSEFCVVARQVNFIFTTLAGQEDYRQSFFSRRDAEKKQAAPTATP